MPKNYIKLLLAGQEMDVNELAGIPVTIDKALEDDFDFQKKTSGKATNISIPSTDRTDGLLSYLAEASNTDTMPFGEDFGKPIPAALLCNGQEVLVGKAIPQKGIRQRGKIDRYEVDIFGDNADWAIDLSELTLAECIPSDPHTFNKNTIESSWIHNGTNEYQYYVYAPARYTRKWGENGDNIEVLNMRPSLFVYWLLYQGFKKAGYRIASAFFDTDYFRRMVMPWTWGNFLYIDSKELDIMKFKVSMQKGTYASVSSLSPHNGTLYGLLGEIMNSSTTIQKNGSFRVDDETSTGYFDNNDNYDYANGSASGTVGKYQMKWTYKPSDFAIFGPIKPVFKFVGEVVSFAGNQNSQLYVNFNWRINGALVTTDQEVIYGTNPMSSASVEEYWRSPNNVVGGDEVTLEIQFQLSPNGNYAEMVMVSGSGSLPAPPTGVGTPAIYQYENAFTYLELIGFEIGVGSQVDMTINEGLKKHKFIDFLRGVIDKFNLSVNTIPEQNVVIFEPTHPFNLGNTMANRTGGYLVKNSVIDWTAIEDISKESQVVLDSSFAQEVSIQDKMDSNDGLLKLLNDRSKLENFTKATYKLPKRFQDSKQVIENRFFSGVVHFEARQFKDISGITPQFIAIIPENVANTSSGEAENVFLPKLAWYKGVVPNGEAGGWRWDGVDNSNLPYMFAVNYQPGGEADPVLSYNDQNIAGVLAQGLFRKFYWQRFHNIRKSKKYITNVDLSLNDVATTLFRDYIQIGQTLYEHVSINAFKPLVTESTEVVLRSAHAITADDHVNIYPSENSVLLGTLNDETDFVYFEQKVLPSDITNLGG